MRNNFVRHVSKIYCYKNAQKGIKLYFKYILSTLRTSDSCQSLLTLPSYLSRDLWVSLGKTWYSPENHGWPWQEVGQISDIFNQILTIDNILGLYIMMSPVW